MMLASGNSAIGPCARNLLAVAQREIPFARSKGIDPDVYDVPFGEAGSYLDESTRDTLAVYEPRVDAGGVDLRFGQARTEDETFYTVSISDKRGDINDDGGGGDG